MSRIIKHALAVVALVAAINYVAAEAMKYAGDLRHESAAIRDSINDTARRRGAWKLKCQEAGGVVFRDQATFDVSCIRGTIISTFDDDVWAFEETSIPTETKE